VLIVFLIAVMMKNYLIKKLYKKMLDKEHSTAMKGNMTMLIILMGLCMIRCAIKGTGDI
jgi:hypothetical protein